MRVLVVGSGTWGTALATVLAGAGREVCVWCRREERRGEIAARRHGNLPGATLPEGIEAVTTADLTGDARGTEFDFVVAALSTQHLRDVLRRESAWLPMNVPWISTSKGVELGSYRLPSEILREEGCQEVAVLSGPSHAEEVVRGVPTAVVLAHESEERARWLQAGMSGESFRVYASTDPLGVEWGGALKNVIALAAGIAHGRGFGDNTLAALVTRGAVEIARLGEALGGRRETFSGLSGIGDLMVTCFSEHSRNRRFGERIGQGESIREILASSDQVVEGVSTARAVAEMCREREVEMPIAEEVFQILHRDKDVDEGVQALLSRSLKAE